MACSRPRLTDHFRQLRQLFSVEYLLSLPDERSHARVVVLHAALHIIEQIGLALVLHRPRRSFAVVPVELMPIVIPAELFRRRLELRELSGLLGGDTQRAIQ